MTVNVADFVFNSETVAKSEKESNMTIVFDPQRRRSTDLESGLAVQWVRDEPPMECRTHFKLIVDGSEVPFEATYDNGWNRMQEKYPDADAIELHRKVSALQELNYHAFDIRGRFDPEVFVRVWQDLISQGLPGYRISTYYAEYRGGGPNDKKEWRCEG